MPEIPQSVSASDPTLARLEDQIEWYDRKSRSAQRIFKRAKIVEILAAAMIPFLAGVSFRHDKLVTAALGVLITILEGILHLNQYQQIWSSYRSTCEALKTREVHLPGNGRSLRGRTQSPGRPGRARGIAGLTGTRAVELDAATDLEGAERSHLLSGFDERPPRAAAIAEEHS
jgi:Protein of unknown function (DUF4231)